MSTDDLFACGLTLLQQAKVCERTHTFVVESIREVVLSVLLGVRDIRNDRGDAPDIRVRNESLTVVVTLTVIVTSTAVGTLVYIGHNFSTSDPGGIPTYPSPP